MNIRLIVFFVVVSGGGEATAPRPERSHKGIAQERERVRMFAQVIFILCIDFFLLLLLLLRLKTCCDWR